VTPVPDPSDPGRHWFEDLADHLGEAYLRYSFTKGTGQEVDFLWSALGLAPGSRVLDVGCGPGRHALELARRGADVVGVDVSERFVEVGSRLAAAAGLADRVRFVRHDARRLDPTALGLTGPVAVGPDAGHFDAAISLCQGAFGLGGPVGPDDPQHLAADDAVLRGVRALLRPGGRLAVSAFSAYFQVRWLEETDDFDASGGVNHERTEVRDPEGRSVPADLWTTCYTPRELRLLADRVGLTVEAIHSVAPGAYSTAAPGLDDQEFLLLARRPGPDPAFPEDQRLG